MADTAETYFDCPLCPAASPVTSRPEWIDAYFAATSAAKAAGWLFVPYREEPRRNAVALCPECAKKPDWSAALDLIPALKEDAR